MPIANVYALYARETGHGMTFDLDGAKPSVQAKGESEAVPTSTKPPGRAAGAGAGPEEAHGGGKPHIAPHQVEIVWVADLRCGPECRFSSGVEQPPCKR